MKGNTFNVCGYTPSHLGWAPQLVVNNSAMTPEAGGSIAIHGYWLDTRAITEPTSSASAMPVSGCRAPSPTAASRRRGWSSTASAMTRGAGGSTAIHGSWPTPPGAAEPIVGFGNAGVWVSRAQADGTYTAPQLVVANFGYAGGWRVDRHPRFLADTTGSGRADIVGFGNAGVWVSRAQADGTYTAPQLVVTNFGYDAGGWRVDQHPRFLADTTLSGRADIVGFGNAVSQCHELRPMAPPPCSWWSPTSAATPGAGGSTAIHGSWPTPPGRPSRYRLQGAWVFGCR